MPPRSRLSREEKGKDIADSPSPTSSPLDDFDLIHRDALRDTENMTLSHRLLVADAHRMIRDEGADRVEVGSSDVSGSENRGGHQSDAAIGSKRGDAEAGSREIRHPNTIAYPEKFFESAQAITAHSHLRWPDLSDGASEGGGTSREGAYKEGASREGAPIVVDQGVGAGTSASGPKKKKKSKKTKGGATDEVPPEESASLDATSEGSKAKKKKEGNKRSRGGAASSVDRDEGLAEGQEGALVGAAPDGRPKKRTKRSVEAELCPSTSDTNAADATLVDVVGEDSGIPENLSEERRKTSS
ncbi:hypothetical protein DY000_02058454 [Brassica cretica]|uniref:Uncharacterized protein n=1 Tax=Brassica cretica TaxID=69181 RepID=A0ABQ7AZJ0_BRACR|nr:hypothetical protein DY000_02058454 [Brassica cretica]